LSTTRLFSCKNCFESITWGGTFFLVTITRCERLDHRSKIQNWTLKEVDVISLDALTQERNLVANPGNGRSSWRAKAKPA
jgi:hypothetical protein